MKFTLLQVPAVDEAKISQAADSLKAATESFASLVKEDPHTAFTQLGQDALNFGLKVLIAIAIYVAGIWLIRKIKKLMKKNFARRKTDATVASFTNSAVTVLLTATLIIICISTLGVNTTSLAALLAAGGMAIGMALSGTLQNFAGGIMLLLFKPFKVGDFIDALGYSGTVSEVTIVSTKLLTTDNKVIILPNGALSSGNVVNYSIQETRRIDYHIPMEHGTDAEKLIEAINAIIAQESRVNDSFVAMEDLDKDSIQFVIKLWVKSEDYWPVFHAFYQNLYTGLIAQGFNFAANRLEINNNERQNNNI